MEWGSYWVPGGQNIQKMCVRSVLRQKLALNDFLGIFQMRLLFLERGMR